MSRQQAKIEVSIRSGIQVATRDGVLDLGRVWAGRGWSSALQTEPEQLQSVFNQFSLCSVGQWATCPCV